MTFRAFSIASAVLTTLAVAAPAVVQAQASDPAAAQVSVLNDSLIGLMKAGGSVESRSRRIEPTVDRVFDVSAMTRTAIGPAWTGFSPADQASLTKAFARFTAATYAKNFDGYDGERFTVDPKVDTRGVDKLVKSQLVSKSGSPTTFIYRMRQSAAGSWKIVDVFYNGAISQVAAQRSQFAAPLAAGGPTAVVKSLEEKTATLLSGK